MFVEGLTYQLYKRVGSGSRPALTHIDRFSIVELNVRLRAVIGMSRQKFGGGPASGEVPEVMGGPAAVTRPPTGPGLRRERLGSPTGPDLEVRLLGAAHTLPVTVGCFG